MAGCSSASGCDLAGADLRHGSSKPVIRRIWFGLHLPPYGHFPRINLRIQITLRCGLVLGSTRCSGSYRQADVALVVLGGAGVMPLLISALGEIRGECHGNQNINTSKAGFRSGRADY